MKIAKKIISGIIFAPYIIFVIISFIIVWFLDNKNYENVSQSSGEFMTANLYLIFLSCISIYAFLIIKIF